MTNDIEKVKAYAARLEQIIEATPLETNTRLLVNSLVGMAKEQYDMYNS